MANIFDVADYILSKQMRITAMKLEKLCYYCQAWTLVWDEKPLFSNKIEAWGRGPVSPELYHWHSGKFIVKKDSTLDNLCSGKLTQKEKENIDTVLRGYGKLTAQELSDLTHKEDPWRIANGTCDISNKCDAEITLAMMHEYYSSLPETQEIEE